MSNLFILTGIPGSGKSTFAKKYFQTENRCIVSRDEIRFSIIKENEEYFSHESEVFETFIENIQNKLTAGFDVCADATHLNQKSRKKLICNIPPQLYQNLYSVFVDTDIKTAIARNENRRDTRSYVPISAIEQMANSLTPPSIEEGFDKLYVVKNDTIYCI